MKRIILSSLAIAAIALSSCKKDPVETTELGSATISGTIVADIDQTNDINEAGLYEAGYAPEGVEGMQVRIEVNTANYEQNPVGGYNYDIETYTATTDADGKFSFTIPTTQDGFTVTLEFQDKHGITRTLYSTTGGSLTEETYISKMNEPVFIYDGATIEVDYVGTTNVVNNATNEYGTATYRGRVFANYDQGFTPEGYQPLGSTSPYPGKEIVLTWDYSAYGLMDNSVMKATIDADGYYEFTVPTELAGMTNVEFYTGIQDWYGTCTGMNMAGTADSTWNANYSCDLFGGYPLFYNFDDVGSGDLDYTGNDIYVEVYLTY